MITERTEQVLGAYVTGLRGTIDECSTKGIVPLVDAINLANFLNAVLEGNEVYHEDKAAGNLRCEQANRDPSLAIRSGTCSWWPLGAACPWEKEPTK